MSASVRLRLICRRGQQVDLRAEEVPQHGCRLHVQPDPGCDDNVIISWTVETRREPAGAQSEVDNPVYRAATGEQVCEHDWHTIRVWNQSGLVHGFDALCCHQESPFDTTSRLTPKQSGVES